MRQSHLNAHVKSAHTGVRDYVCDIDGCDKSFTTGTRLRRHKAVHENKANFQCKDFPPCEQVFRKHATLQRHIEADHFGLMPFVCENTHESTGEKCSERFETAEQLRRHKRQAHISLSHACLICVQASGETAARFASHGELQEHMKQVHPPVCLRCDYVARSAAELERHVEMKHTGQDVDARKVFSCEYVGCDKTFTRKSNLQSHVKSAHEKRKPFVCGDCDLSASKGLHKWDSASACGQSFAHKHSLEDHVRRKHVGKSPEKAQAKPRKRATRTSNAASLLTGNQLPAESFVTCALETCGQGLADIEELRMHLSFVHMLTDFEVEEAMVEQEALSGGKFWLGGTDDEFDDMVVHSQTSSMVPAEPHQSGFIDPMLTRNDLRRE